MSDNLCIVKARKVGNSIVLTVPYAIDQQYYSISVTNTGVIACTPLKRQIRESTAKRLNSTLDWFED